MEQYQSLLSEYELTASRVSPKRTRVDTGSTTFLVGKDVNPVEYFLGAIAACVNSTGTMVARDMDMSIDDLEITVGGPVDYARYHGHDTDARPGLQSISVTIDIETDADEATVDVWLQAVKERCPITDSVEHPTPLEIAVST